MIPAAIRIALTLPIFRVLLLVALLAGSGLSVRSEVKPGRLFSDNAVLQRGVEVAVWGTANDNEQVTVRFQNQTVTTTAKEGRWMVHLKPLGVGGPFVMTINGENTITLTNVLVGEVWLCSGQSNMEMPLAAAAHSAEATASARDPQLRLFTVPHEASDEPMRDLSVQCDWQEARPGNAKYFSAVGYFFGRDLRKALKVPVGLIHSSVGGTPAEAWTARAVFEADPDLKPIIDEQAQAIKNFDQSKADAEYEAAVAKAKAEGRDLSKVPPASKGPAFSMGRPSGLYNAMIAPLQPFALAGVIWYQGESNNRRPNEYRKLFPAMIHNWRDAWGEGDFPFLFVQIALHREMTPELREAQLLTWQKVPRTAMVVITDVSEPENIHPVQKEPVGARLALAARAIAYGEKIEYSGPVYDSMKIEGGHAVVSFTHFGGGLVAKGGELEGFSVAGQDGHFVSATAQIEADTVIVSNPSVAAPVAVRYGWGNAPDVNLFNQQGLPATPFRTDVK
jgi:sialate O-acetylesterase